MEFIFILSQENISLSRFELETLMGRSVKVKENLAFLESKTNVFSDMKRISRLALARQGNILLFSCNKNDLAENIKSFNWNKYFEEDFYLSTVHMPDNIDKKKLADIIFRKIEKPKTNVNNPKTIFEIIFEGNTAHVTIRKWINKDDFESRKAHKRAEHHPTSLHPKLAKALINLSGVKRGKIIDPFCGSGGIILEAGLMGLKPIGYDIDEIMLRRAKLNLDAFNLENYRLKLRDARKLEKCNYVITDPPYGKSSKGKNIQQLYVDFMKTISEKVGKRAVIIFPDEFEYSKYASGFSLEIKGTFKWYVHKKMTRNIVIFDPKNR